MANFCILRIKKLHSNSNVAGAISHHLRTRETENADPEKMKQNWFFPNEGKNSPNEKIEYRQKMQRVALARYKKNLPEKVRKNGVRAVEFMMTVSPEVLQRKDFDSIKYLNSCTTWARDKFGNENVFFVAYHLDEKTPHISLLLTPKDENGKLNARKFFGGREKMSELQDDFFNAVGKQFGLERGIRGSKAHHKTIKEFYTELNQKNAELEQVAESVYIPDKKFGQSNYEYSQTIKKNVAKAIKSLQPLVTESINANQTRQRLDKLQTKFDDQVKTKAQSEIKKGTAKISADYEKLKDFTTNLYAENSKLQIDYRDTKTRLDNWRNLSPNQLEELADKKRREQVKQRLEQDSNGFEM